MISRLLCICSYWRYGHQVWLTHGSNLCKRFKAVKYLMCILAKCAQIRTQELFHLHTPSRPRLLWWLWRSRRGRPDTLWRQKKAGSDPADTTHKSPARWESDYQVYTVLRTPSSGTNITRQSKHLFLHPFIKWHVYYAKAKTEGCTHLYTQWCCGSASRQWRFPLGRTYTPADPPGLGRNPANSSHIRYVPENNMFPLDTAL